MSSLRRFRPTSKLDIGVAVVLTIFSVGDWLGGARLDSPLLAAAGLVVAVIPAVAFAWRAKLEWKLLAIAVPCSAAAVLLHATDSGIPILAAVYTVAARRGWRAAAVAWAVTCASFAFAVAINVGARGDTTTAVLYAIVAALLAAGIAAIGLYVGSRRGRFQRLIDRNAALERERDLLERERELLAREAIAVERARIARELHAVVAHHVSVMVIQTGAAEATLPPGAEQTRATLEATRDSGREALTEMRRMLGVLREPASDAAADEADGGAEGGVDGGAERATREPQPGVSRIPVLVARMKEAGVTTTLQYSGRTRRLPAALDVSVYRVVQEALTNTVRHAGRGAAARVGLTFEPDCLAVEITDDGFGSPEARPDRPDRPGQPGGRTERDGERTERGGGHGLVGMQERVALFGGTLETGPVRGAGWRVCARFPIDPVPEAE